MKFRHLFFILPVAFCRADDSAVLKRPLQSGSFVQVQISGPAGTQLQAVLIESTDDATSAVASSPTKIRSEGGMISFALPLSSFNPKATYIVAVPPLSQSDVPRALTVKNEMTVSIGLSPVCSGLALRLKSPTSISADEWKAIVEGLESNPSSVSVIIHKPGAQDEQLTPKAISLGMPEISAQQRFAELASNAEGLACIELSKTLPTDSYRATVQFRNPPRAELAGAIVNDSMSGSKLAQPDNKPPADTPGNRDLEKNLDASVMFTSSVNPPKATAARPCAVNGKRCDVGVLDIRLAPWLNILSPQLAAQKWIGLYTPFYIDAAISTGPIDSDTVSQDRVIFGTEYEFRRYNSLAANSSFNRVILRASHASDRDFKQKEYAASIRS
jgi:hypothetical protein